MRDFIPWDSQPLETWSEEHALESGQAMHRILRGSRFEILEDAGHLPNFEQPELFNKMAVEFLVQTDE